MKTSKPKAPVYADTCVYAGRRLARSKVYRTFYRADGTEMNFRGVRGVHLGFTYKCGKKNIASRPERVFEVERVDNPAWEAADALVDSHNMEKRARANVAKISHPNLKAAIAALVPLCTNLDYLERREFCKYLMIQVDKKMKGSKK